MYEITAGGPPVRAVYYDLLYLYDPLSSIRVIYTIDNINNALSAVTVSALATALTGLQLQLDGNSSELH